MTVGASAKTRRGRFKLVLLATIAAAPLIVAYALFFSGWRPAGSANYGELVQPPRGLRDIELVDLSGKALKLSSLRGKWLYVYFGPSRCRESCRNNLYKTRQVITAQEKNMDRVQRLFVLTDGEALSELQDTLKDHPGLHVARPGAEALQSLARDFLVPAGSPLAGLERVYLVDPLGNLMMSYPADADPTGMRKDLARLLRASRVG